MNKKVWNHKISCAFTIFIFCVCIFLTSCVSKSKINNEVSSGFCAVNLRPVYITNSKKIMLLLPEYNTVEVDSIQLLNGSFGDTEFSLMSYTQIDSTGISLSLMNDFGTDMGNVFYDGEKVVFDSAYFPKQLPGEYIIADIQNAFYDSAVLKSNYEKSGLTFEEEKNENSTIRKIIDKKKVIEEIRIEEKSVSINNYLRNYKYVLISE